LELIILLFPELPELAFVLPAFEPLLKPLLGLFIEFELSLPELLKLLPNGFSFDEAAAGSPAVVERRRVGLSVKAWSSVLGMHDEKKTKIRPPTTTVAPFKFLGVDLCGAR